MENHQKIIDDMESLWFFSNILSPPPPSPAAEAVAVSAAVTQDGDQADTAQSHDQKIESFSSGSANQEKPKPSIHEQEQISASSSDSKVGSSSDFDSGSDEQLQRKRATPVTVKEQEWSRRTRSIQIPIPGRSIREGYPQFQPSSDFDGSTGSEFESEQLQEKKKKKRSSISPVIVKEAAEEWSRRNRWLVTDMREWNYLEQPQGFEVIQGLRNLGFDFGNPRVSITRSSRNNNPYLVRKMPSLNDGRAMKKHLKSWAQAVACTVR